MIRFRNLRSKLTVLYMGLFGLALILTAIAVVTAVTRSAERMVRAELIATGEVYDQIWSARSEQLRQGAAVLAQDFGFREAVATGDDPTVQSALANLAARQGVEGALLMLTDGHVVAEGVQLDDAALDALWAALDGGERDDGVLRVEGQEHQVVAAPIRAPVLLGWVIFVQRLDAAQMRELEGLSAIPLEARIAPAAAEARTQPMIADGRMSLARPLPSFDADGAELLLAYPMAKAMAPYGLLFAWLGVIAVAGAGMMLAGTWLLSRTITRPIQALDDAVHRLQAGERAEVEVASDDELGRLAHSFNRMAGAIRDREDKLNHLALHDHETGLRNRLALERALATQPGACVVVLQVARFDTVRAAVGHDAAAQLLTQLGARLQAITEDAPARIAAGLLALRVEGETDQALAWARQVRAAVEGSFIVNGAPIDVQLIIGVAGPAEQTRNLSLIDRAVVAVDQAGLGAERAAAFDAEAYGDPSGNLSIIGDLMRALDNGEFSLSYQPKYDLRDGRITGVEALARWTHPQRGFVSPDVFITIAEETGHIRQVTDWVLRRAIVDQQRLAADGVELEMSVNISGRLLGDAAFVKAALDLASGASGKLCLEITETAVIDNADAAIAAIERFAEAGVKMSIDDYGSGLSSLAYLKRLPASELKIDKAFVMKMDAASRDALLVKSTIDLAHALGMRVTAEGVETDAALALLKGMGCDMAQGYLIARPMSVEALVEMLAGAGSAAPKPRRRRA
ncbi:putative bifunctional diguanylate cyclase/phosphodiesterase [Brevundimonas balnearis]|uniref:Bifunctional diguanylate cyclase/phosphodiesterase n=1 Tax=Brevundimonas balnearis TaxID=1572858 RepID=A0ABV6R4H8_9CAUL